jgi:hypothetical protein
MEKKIKEPKQKILFEIVLFSNTNRFNRYFVAKNVDEAIKKAKIIFPYYAILSYTEFNNIYD